MLKMKDWAYPITNISCTCHGGTMSLRLTATVRDALGCKILCFMGAPHRSNKDAIAMATEFCAFMNATKPCKVKNNGKEKNMTNQEKYKTAKERKEGFRKFCKGKRCEDCPLNDNAYDEDDCRYLWLELEALMTTETVVKILAKYSKWRKGKPGEPCPYTQKGIDMAIDRAIEILRNVKE